MGVHEQLQNFLFLPELKLEKIIHESRTRANYYLVKDSQFEVCPKCATPSSSVYDRRKVCIRDEPIRGKQVRLIITKRRLWCKECYKPFTEPVQGIRKNHLTTERFKRAIFNACLQFKDLKTVQRRMECSTGMVYKSFYGILSQKEKQHRYPAPSKIGIDEHSLRKPKYQATEYATMIVDQKKKDLRPD